VREGWVSLADVRFVALDEIDTLLDAPSGYARQGGGGGGGAGGVSWDIAVFGAPTLSSGYASSNRFALPASDATGGSGGDGGSSPNTSTGGGGAGADGASGNVTDRN
jgi:hypothetical protein